MYIDLYPYYTEHLCFIDTSPHSIGHLSIFSPPHKRIKASNAENTTRGGGHTTSSCSATIDLGAPCSYESSPHVLTIY